MGSDGTTRAGNRAGLGETVVLSVLDGDLGDAILQGTRLHMMAILASQEAKRRGGYSIQELGERLACSAQNAHHHLKVLDKVGAVRLVRTEATQRIPRQFWVSDVRRICLRADGTEPLDLDLGVSEKALRQATRRLKTWAERTGHVDPSAAARLAAFVAGLDDAAADELLRILHELRQGV